MKSLLSSYAFNNVFSQYNEDVTFKYDCYNTTITSQVYEPKLIISYFSVMGYWWPAEVPQYVGALLSRSKCYCVRTQLFFG